MSYPYVTILDTIADLRKHPKGLFTPYYAFRTLGRTAAFDGGAAEYEWRPDSLEDDDGVFVIKLDGYGIGPGRLHLRRDPLSGVFDASCAGLDTTGQTPCGMAIMQLAKTAARLGFTTMLLPEGRMDVRDWVGDSNDSRVQGITNIAIKGRGRGKTILSAYVPNVGELPLTVRLATQGPLPAYVAAGSGVGKTITMVANGQCGFDNDPIGTIASVGASSVTMNPTSTTPSVVYFNGLTINPGDVIMYGTEGNVGATVLNANPATGLINFTGAKPVGLVVGGSAYKARLIAAGDRVLLRTSDPDAGVYLNTQQGNGATPAIFTRTTDFDTSSALYQRLLVRTTDGSTSAKYQAYVLSALPGEYYDSSAMTIDVTPQYWYPDRFIGAHFMLWPGCEQLIFGYAIPAYPPTHWTERVNAGQTLMHNVQYLNGGTWVDPDNGVTYTFSALKPGDWVYNKHAGTWTDQGQWWVGYKAKVLSINKTTNDVLVDVPAQERSVMVSSAGTPGAYDSYVDTGRWKVGQISAVGANQFTVSPAYLAGAYKAGDNAYVSTLSTGGTYRVGTGVCSADGNPTTGVVTLNVGTLPVGTIIGDYAFHQFAFPNASQQRAMQTNDNVYVKITADVGNVEISDLTLDGVSFNMGFVTNLHIHDVAIENVHVGTLFSGCTGAIERVYFKNVVGFAFPNEAFPSPLCFYGWAMQNNFSLLVYRDIYLDGVSCDIVDQEGEGEIQGYSLTAKLKPTSVVRSSQAIAGTTPNCIRRNPWVNFTVYGVYSATPTITEPIHNLNWSAFETTLYTTGFAGGSSALFSGILTFKNRRYEMSRRRHWQFFCPITGPATRIFRRPWQGLWANTKIYAPSITGWTSLAIGPDYAGSTDLIGVLQSNFAANKWVSFGSDEFAASYPNGTDNELQAITLTTNGTVPAGSYFILATDIIPEVNRGDGYSGFSDENTTQIPPQAGYQLNPDASIPFRLYGTASPIGAVLPDFPGQQYFNNTATALYEAYDVLNNNCWKQVW